MKNLKRLMAGLMAISMVSTMGVSTLVGAEETQKTFYTGDVNLDGKVNTIDLIMLKKMILGLVDLQEMYIDGDTLKLVEGTQGEQVSIIVTNYTVDVETSTINVIEESYKWVEEETILKVTDDTIFNLENITNVQELANSDYTFDIEIVYDSVTKEIVEMYGVEAMPPITDTVSVTPYDNTISVNLEENTITIEDKNKTFWVDDDTIYTVDGVYFDEAITLSDIKDFIENYPYEIPNISITYNGYNNHIDKITVYLYDTICDKPVIYLYPTEETQVDVSLDLNGKLTCTYPKYEDGWSVTAEPDGTLYDTDGNEYYCLYWEGIQNVEYDLSKGFVVKGEDTAYFLREKLLYMGLTPKEANEFIIYWLPKMESNAYNLITFQDDIYTENAKLDITPTPDSMLRIFMAYKPLDEYVEIEPQELSTFERDGFVAVEWGGTEIN